MGSFLQAVRRHRVVALAAGDGAARAGDLWNAVALIGAQATGFPEAVADTLPPEHAPLLASDDVAAATAFELMWSRWRALPAGMSPFELRDVARDGWSLFDEAARRTHGLADGFGWDVSTAWTHARDVQLASVDVGQIERIARLAGRMYVALAGTRARRVHGVPPEVHGIEQGNDVSRLLPSEQVILTETSLELVVLERLATRRAAQYAVRGERKQARGPLVIALDESGSMHGPRNEWAKAAAVALTRVASGDRRAVIVVHFSTSTVAQVLPAKDASATLRMVRHFLGGGTAIGLALSVAAEELKLLSGRGQPGGDVILVTDGVDGDEASQSKAVSDIHRLGARLWTVAIECDVAPRSPLRSSAVHFTRLGAGDLSDPESVCRLEYQPLVSGGT